MLIATRALNLRRPGSPDIEVPIRIFAPEKEPEKAWGCRFEIDWPDRQQAITARGFDAVQAIELAMQMIGVQLYTSNYHEAGQLMFEKPGSGYGFPLPAPLRDLLIGDDAKSY